MDWAAAELARGQYGRVSRAQLLELGFGPDAIEHRLRRGRLHVVHRGVYALGYLGATQEAVWIAAVLAGGLDAVLSHWAAAALWRIYGSGGPVADVTMACKRRSRPNIRFHRAALPADEITVHRGIPVTTPPRTLFDLAAHLSPRRLERAMNEADVQRLWGDLSLEDLLARHPAHRGARTAREALALRPTGETVTRSALERLLVEFLDDTGIRWPEMNALLDLGDMVIEVDALWRAERVALELDSRAFHDVAAAFEEDRRRDRKLAARGWRPVRVTWRQLTSGRGELEADLRRLVEGATLAA